MKNTTKKIQITASGYYDGFEGKMVLLKEGDVLELIGVGEGKDVKEDCWECRTDNGKTAYVEFENGKVSA